MIALALIGLAACDDDAAGSEDAGSNVEPGDPGDLAGDGDASSGARNDALPSGEAGAPGGPPEPIPVLGEEPPPLCAGPKPADYFQFLDDTCDAKRLPTHVDREQACPIVDPSAAIALSGGGVATYRPASAATVIENALDGIVPDALDVVVTEIRRVNGVPHYRTLSNGSAETAVQPWSTTKWLAAANAGARLRLASKGAVGLTASVDGRPLGDLITSIANYDEAPYSSNALGRYMHDIGGRARANDLIHGGWLQRPAGETFGGNYGAASPPLGSSFVEPNGASITIVPDGAPGLVNKLSMLTLAEALKRVVLHREEPTQRLPNLTWADAQVLLYGAAGSAKYGAWGGLSVDDAIYMQSAHDWDYIERRSKGRWRVFSKLGLGTDGQFLDLAYACLPVIDDGGQPVPGWGRELVIAAHLPSGGATWAERDRLLARAFRSILIRVVDGRL